MVNRRQFTGLAALVAGLSLGGAGSTPPDRRISHLKLRSDLVPGAVGVNVFTPEGYDPHRPQPYPLLLLLHGGNGSERDLLRFAPALDRAIAEGRLPPAVVAMPGARRSLYMDYRDGSERWETFILHELLPHLQGSFRVSTERRRNYIAGWSMGGLGSLRMAFKHPDRFGAVAALEPAIEPALSWHAIGPHVRFWRSEAIARTIYGSPIDRDYWAANNPATIASRQPERLLGLGLYFEAGDQDMLYLHEGAEFLHRILFDAGIGHEYRLVRGADHVGPSLHPRFADALDFIGRQIVPPEWIDASVLRTRALMDEQKRAMNLPVETPDPRRIRGR